MCPASDVADDVTAPTAVDDRPAPDDVRTADEPRPDATSTSGDDEGGRPDDLISVRDAAGLVGKTDLGLKRARGAGRSIVDDKIDLHFRMGGDEGFDGGLARRVGPYGDRAVGGDRRPGSGNGRKGYHQMFQLHGILLS